FDSPAAGTVAGYSMHGISYCDFWHVTGASTHIDIDNGTVESAGSSFFNRAVIRVLCSRGWGILLLANYARPRGTAFEELLASAACLAAITGEEVNLAPATGGTLSVPEPVEDPRDVSLEEKTSLLAAIERSAKREQVVNTRGTYAERIEQVRFEDSSGSDLSYEICRSGFSVLAVASRNGTIQMGYERQHTIRGLNLRGQEEQGRQAAATAVALLDARAAKGGTMHAVLDPELAGVFAHEAVGHASEGDLVQQGSSVLGGKTGERIGSDTLTIVDDPTLTEFGFEPFDAEGVAVARTEIIRKGVLSSFLHSRETLAAVGNGTPGHARAMPGEPPVVRMSNTFIENGDATYEEILGECKNGILLKGSRGGQVDPGRGVF
ncbi:TldD/PmbA family protein, partial [Methanoregula sp.]|uniref:TldD/PmbA family protein n=1 Tax=Methanoregula sp. TaxID=2052170 RepID=UPI003741F360